MCIMITLEFARQRDLMYFDSSLMRVRACASANAQNADSLRRRRILFAVVIVVTLK